MFILFCFQERHTKMSKSSMMCVGILWTTLLVLFFTLVSTVEQSSRNIRLRYRRNSNDEIGKITLQQWFSTWMPGHEKALEECCHFLNLASITRKLKLKVPPNYSITKEGCREYRWLRNSALQKISASLN